MKEIATTVTRRGQVTIPAEVRRLLGPKPRDRVVFQIQDQQVRLAPVPFTLETAYGSVKPRRRPEDFKELSRLAREEHADQAIREMQSS